MQEPLAAGNADGMRSMDRLRELETAFGCRNAEYECSDYWMSLKPLLEVQNLMRFHVGCVSPLDAR